ncbi:MAG TPA: aldehyde dehydrogenase family protein [Pirellulales bacterium]|jgi:NADP-dependent aldehyde dehydrogenase|nr:aldehyde dehydrogenase family protein [Pirellulales bacterium]
MQSQPVLIDGQWRAAAAVKTFQAENPITRELLADLYPVSSWSDCEAALEAAVAAAERLREISAANIARFLERAAERIEARRGEIVAVAHLETGLPVAPRLAEVELPRTTNQLRQAAVAAREGSWALPTIDVTANIRSCFAPIGPVCVFGPNNFPLAFNGICGGDFAAAIAAGNPVIAKGHPSHPGTTRFLAEEIRAAAAETEMPRGAVQLLYRLSPTDGLRLVSDRRIGATGFTGSRRAGLQLKTAADAAGKPIYLEMSSINPVVVLPHALTERSAEIVDQFVGSCLAGTGQFCTNPGLVVLLAGEQSEAFVAAVAARFRAAPVGTLLAGGVAKALAAGIEVLRSAGAEVVAGGAAGGGKGHSHANTVLRVSGRQFLASTEALQTEAFGNASLFVVAADVAEAVRIIDTLEGNLTGSIYSDTAGRDDAAYRALAARLRSRVGRLINDKMPTGVAVSPAMNHGGPFPATGHPGFTAVGMPAALRRFAMLVCYDNVRRDRLPPLLADKNPTGQTWRLIDGRWTQADVPSL